MEKSIENQKKFEIRKYGFYVFTKGLEKGLGVLVFDVDDKAVKGVKLIIGQTVKVEYTRVAFDNMLAYGLLEFTELIPKTVWKEFKKVYDK